MAEPNGAIAAGRFWTAVFLVVLIHFILAWDIFAGLKWGERATISDVLRGWIYDHPIIAFSTGVLVGHIVWGKM